jgi:hypothetical protein
VTPARKAPARKTEGGHPAKAKVPPLPRKQVPRYLMFDPGTLRDALPGHMALPRTRAEAVKAGQSRFFPYDEATHRLRICRHDHVAAHSVKGGCCECIRLADRARKSNAKTRQAMIDRKLRAAFIKLDMETQKGFLVDAMAHRLAKGRLIAQGIKHSKMRNQMIVRGLTAKQRRNAYDRSVAWYKKEVARTVGAVAGEPPGKPKKPRRTDPPTAPRNSG